MSKRSVVGILLCCFLPAVPAIAQDTPEGGLIVRSEPPGAEIILKGEAIVSGVAPTFFRQGLVGEYALKVKMPGYEDHTTKLILDPTKQMEVAVRLSPKTRIKAAARSLFVPGWGQRYSEQKTKGFLFHALAAGSIAAFLIADHHFNDKYDIYTQRLEAFDSTLAAGGSYGDLQRMQSELADAQDEAYDAEDVRRITVGAVVAVWAFSVADVLFFFPERRSTFSVRGLTLSPDADAKSIGLTLSHRF
jgi:hypothetical protein